MLRASLAVLALAAVVAGVPTFNIPTAPNGGARWALIIAGSDGWGNYRHQADAYHAYQIMKTGGLDDDHIIVFHKDDIANNSANPKPGTVINSPTGSDVYHGVPKDYTGAEVTPTNFLAALAGKKENIVGGSGKVVASGPDDVVFVFYVDHGGPGILGMPSGQPFLYAKDIISTLEAKAAAKGFAQLVFYIEACESGSIFEGTLPANINIYATTASNAQESSWGCYCPGMAQPPPAGYNTCLGDLYAVAWMENVDAVGRLETLETQYTLVRDRVSQNGSFSEGSHVMQYGQLSLDTDKLDLFLGDAPGNANAIVSNINAGVVPNRDAELLYLGAAHPERLMETLHRRSKLDARMLSLASALSNSAEDMMTRVSTPVVEDWDCYKTNVATFEAACGPLGQYGMKHGRTLANLCNAGVTTEQVKVAAARICA
jgi:legumain